MTVITDIPFIKDDDGFGIAPLIVTAMLVNSTGALLDTQERFEFDIYSRPRITLDTQPFNTAWRINTRQGDIVNHKSVIIGDDTESWNTLTEVDETTLHPIPTGEAKAAWDAFLNKLKTIKGDTGPQGIQGERGFKGDRGDTGAAIKGDKGDTGAQGVKGDTGAQGLKGDIGNTGPRGIQGVVGDTGATGATGPQGIQGVKGDTGARGMVGPAGLNWQGVFDSTRDYVQNDSVYYDGASWFATYDPPPGAIPGGTGSYWTPLSLRGVQGVKGDTGAQGVKGDTGATGSTGPQGIQGVKGDTGATGAASTVAGPKGDTGAQGIQGIAGIQGIQGVKGDTGATGATGATGPSGSAAGKACRYTSNSALNAASKTNTVVPIDTLQLNDDTSYYSIASNVITIAKSGLYLVIYSGNVTCTSTYSLFVQRNSTALQEASTVSGQTVAAATIFRFTAGDTVTLRVYGNAAATVAAGALLGLTYLEGVKGDTGATGPAATVAAGTLAPASGWTGIGGIPCIVQKGSDGRVHGSFGATKNSGSVVVNDIPFVLPAGFRPPANTNIPIVVALFNNYANPGTAYMLINPDGSVNVTGISGTAPGVTGSFVFGIA